MCIAGSQTACCLFVNIFHIFRLFIFVDFSISRVSSKYIVPLCTTTLYIECWSGSKVLGSNRFSGASLTPRWWQPYSWCICMSGIMVYTTWWRGDSQGILEWLLLPPPTIIPPIILKGKIVTTAWGKSLGTFYFPFFWYPKNLLRLPQYILGHVSVHDTHVVNNFGPLLSEVQYWKELILP